MSSLPKLRNALPSLAAAADARAGVGVWNVCTSEFERTRRAYFEARRRFAERNIALVYRVALKYRSRELDTDDLVSEGTLGLMRAIDRYDYRKGRFSTYATWWIRRSIVKALGNSGVISVNQNYYWHRSRIDRAIQKHLARFGSSPSLTEIEADTRLPGREIRKILTAGALDLRVCSLSTSLGDTDLTVENYLAVDEPSPLEVLEGRDARKVATRLMSGLDARERKVIRLRFKDDLTLQQIGDRVGRTRERIRQIEENALAKMTRRGRAEFGRECANGATAHNY